MNQSFDLLQEERHDQSSNEATRAIVHSMDSFSSSFEQAMRNRNRLAAQELRFPDFQLRSHLLVTLYLYRREGISRLDLLEMCGSELAVA